MLLFKLLFFLITFITAIFGILLINKLPSERLSAKQNYLRISLFSTIGAIIDFIMFWVIVGCIPDGEYGTGIEVAAMIFTVICYGVPCVVTSFFLKKRLKKYNQNKYNTAQICGLNISVIFKVLFVFIWVIWLVES